MEQNITIYFCLVLIFQNQAIAYVLYMDSTVDCGRTIELSKNDVYYVQGWQHGYRNLLSTFRGCTISFNSFHPNYKGIQIFFEHWDFRCRQGAFMYIYNGLAPRRSEGTVQATALSCSSRRPGPMYTTQPYMTMRLIRKINFIGDYFDFRVKVKPLFTESRNSPTTIKPGKTTPQPRPVLATTTAEPTATPTTRAIPRRRIPKKNTSRNGNGRIPTLPPLPDLPPILPQVDDKNGREYSPRDRGYPDRYRPGSFPVTANPSFGDVPFPPSDNRRNQNDKNVYPGNPGGITLPDKRSDGKPPSWFMPPAAFTPPAGFEIPSNDDNPFVDRGQIPNTTKGGGPKGILPAIINSGMPTTLIGGLAAAGVVVLISPTICTLIVCIYCNKKKKRQREMEQQQKGPAAMEMRKGTETAEKGGQTSAERKTVQTANQSGSGATDFTIDDGVTPSPNGGQMFVGGGEMKRFSLNVSM